MRQRRLKNEINVVPYIDVMLVLLVIFMVATPMMTTGSVDLPSSGTAPQKPDKYARRCRSRMMAACRCSTAQGQGNSNRKGMKELKGWQQANDKDSRC
jgi:biopolymer transport protein TolR